MTYDEEMYDDARVDVVMMKHAIFNANSHECMDVHQLYGWCKRYVERYESMKLYQKFLEEKKNVAQQQ